MIQDWNEKDAYAKTISREPRHYVGNNSQIIAAKAWKNAPFYEDMYFFYTAEAFWFGDDRARD